MQLILRVEKTEDMFTLSGRIMETIKQVKKM